MEAAPRLLKKTAQLAGLFWFLSAATAGFNLGYVRTKLVVWTDAGATASNIVSHESLFRLGVASGVVGQIFLILFGLTAYGLLRRVSKIGAGVFLAFIVMSAAIATINSLNNLAAVAVLSRADYLSAFGQEQLNAAMIVFLRLNNLGVGLGELFLSPALFALGLLLIKSKLVPKILGILTVIGSCGFPINTFTKILAPQFYPAAFTQLAMLGGALLLPVVIWLLVKGVREPPPISQA